MSTQDINTKPRCRRKQPCVEMLLQMFLKIEPDKGGFIYELSTSLCCQEASARGRIVCLEDSSETCYFQKLVEAKVNLGLLVLVSGF